MTIESQVLEALRSLSPVHQAEVLDFAEFLRSRATSSGGLRPSGLCEGEFQVPDDFDAPLPESVLREFEG